MRRLSVGGCGPCRWNCAGIYNSHPREAAFLPILLQKDTNSSASLLTSLHSMSTFQINLARFEHNPEELITRHYADNCHRW